MTLLTSVTPAQGRHSYPEQTQADPQHRSPPRVRSGIRAWPVLPAVIAVLLLAWAIVMLVVPDISFILLDPRTKIGLEVLRAIVSLLAALILVLFPDDLARILREVRAQPAPGNDEAMVAPGAGLGRYLSRRVIRASGSELRVRSDPRRETCSCFDLEAVR